MADSLQDDDVPEPNGTAHSIPQPKLDAVRIPLGKALDEVETLVHGQRATLDRIAIGLLTGGHLLIEGVPGLAKTLIVRSLAQVLHAEFSRIQFTPDLLPADLIGTQVYRQETGEFTTKKGPVFSNIVLADEINRAPAKVQSALLEAMQEGRVTIGEQTHVLPSVFLVLATQNPIEHEGTYPLPEAQLDRFSMKLRISYPDRSAERVILAQLSQTAPDLKLQALLDLEWVEQARKIVDQIHVSELLLEYVLDLLAATRNPERFDILPAGSVRLGASPRAGLHLILAAKAQALFQGRDFVTPGDVKAVTPDVLGHRIHLDYEQEARGETVANFIDSLLNCLKVP